MPKKNDKVRQAVRAEAKAKARPTRSRPTINTATYTKVCTVCKVEKLAEGNFFRVQAMADGYASRCKACWNVRGVERPPAVDRAPEAAPVARRAYPHLAGVSPHSHTRAEEKALEKSTGLPLAGYTRMGNMLVPVLTTRDAPFLDEEPRR